MTVSAVIPAHNEEERIGAVIRVLCQVDKINEILVVDDGSEDNTFQAAFDSGASVLKMQANGGKASAMCAGAAAAAGDILLFVDADLSGLLAEHITSLLEPVLNGKADMSVGIFSSGRVSTDIAQFVSPQLSGQRVLRRDVFLRVAAGMEDSGYGIESVITKYSKKEEWNVEIVEFNGVSQVTKEEKLGFSKGAVARLKMYSDIVKTIGSRKKFAHLKKPDSTYNR